jgi:peptidoglycan/LPS O-acetylase OafA/YrhL
VGTYRLVLALCVVVAHASPIPFIRALDAGLAVKTFFMISGFYMALILKEKYPGTPEGRNLFYTNRLLRIYPMYVVTLVGAVLFYVAASLYLGHPADRLALWAEAWKGGRGGALLLIAATQLTVVGLDVTPLFGYSAAEGFHLLAAGSSHAWRFNFLPHCWSIGAELLFYAMAPRLVSLRTGVQAVLCVATLAPALAIQGMPGALPNSAAYHLGILQLPYFLLGILAYTGLQNSSFFRPSAKAAAIPVLAVLVLTFSGWPALGRAGGFVYLFCAWLLLPALFHVSRKSSWDRWVGELSYPIYLLHVPMKWVLLAARGVDAKDAAQVSGIALVAATLAAAGLMVAAIDRPLERFRRRRFERQVVPS